jgi:hypothetical protein
LWFGRLTERAAGSSPRLHLGVTGRLPCTAVGVALGCPARQGKGACLW